MYCSRGWFFVFGFGFFIGCVGGYISGCWVVAEFLCPGPGVPGLRRWMTTQMAKLNCCRAVGVEQQGDAI